MSRKRLTQTERKRIHAMYNGRCAYCGKPITLKQMQVDHIKSVYIHTEVRKDMSQDQINADENLLPACRQCNFYKATFPIDEFRKRIQGVMMDNLRKNFNYRMAVAYGLIEETGRNVKFLFETER